MTSKNLIALINHAAVLLSLWNQALVDWVYLAYCFNVTRKQIALRFVQEYSYACIFKMICTRYSHIHLVSLIDCCLWYRKYFIISHFGIVDYCLKCWHHNFETCFILSCPQWVISWSYVVYSFAALVPYFKYHFLDIWYFGFSNAHVIFRLCFSISTFMCPLWFITVPF